MIPQPRHATVAHTPHIMHGIAPRRVRPRARRSRWLSLAACVALALVLAIPAAADAQRRRRRGKRARHRNHHHKTTPRRPKRRTKTKVFDFTGLQLGGRLRAPQLLYFLDRVSEELDRAALKHRSFLPELTRSVEEEPL